MMLMDKFKVTYKQTITQILSFVVSEYKYEFGQKENGLVMRLTANLWIVELTQQLMAYYKEVCAPERGKPETTTISLQQGKTAGA